MKCPFCDSDQIVVANSRLTRKGIQIWRRRKCLSCGLSFTTYERIELSYLKVVKKNKRKEFYHRGKLYSGIYSAILGGKKVDRGDAGELAEEVMQSIEERILKTGKREISTDALKSLVVKQLSRKDWRSAVRYFAYFAGGERKWWKSLVKLMSINKS